MAKFGNKELIVVEGSFKEKTNGGVLTTKTSFEGNVNVELWCAELKHLKMNIGNCIISSCELVTRSCKIKDDMNHPKLYFEEFGSEVIYSVFENDEITLIVLIEEFDTPTDYKFIDFPFDIPEFADFETNDSIHYKCLQFDKNFIINKDNIKDKCTIIYSKCVNYISNYTSTMTDAREIFNQFNKNVIEKDMVEEDDVLTIIFNEELFMSNKKVSFINFPFDFPKHISRPKLNAENSEWRTWKFVKKGKNTLFEKNENVVRYNSDFLKPLNFKICNINDKEHYIGDMQRINNSNSDFDFNINFTMTSNYIQKDGTISISIYETNTCEYLNESNIIDDIYIFMQFLITKVV